MTSSAVAASDVATRRRRTSRQIAASILDILGRCERPIGAHELASRTTQAGLPLTATQAYRTLGRFIRAGLVQRVESRNAFMLRTCQHPILLLCTGCQVVTEIDDGGAADLLLALAADRVFQADGIVLEIRGRCRACARKSPRDGQ